MKNKKNTYFLRNNLNTQIYSWTDACITPICCLLLLFFYCCLLDYLLIPFFLRYVKNFFCLFIPVFNCLK